MDREKVVNDLNIAKLILCNPQTLTPRMHIRIGQAITSAIAMLKEQEAKPMTEYDDGWDCPRCGLKLIGKTASGCPCDELDLPNDEIVKYCPICGQAVKWNG